MTNEEARAYFIDSNERIISVAKDENRYNYETQQIEDIFMRRDFEAKEKAIKALEQQDVLDKIRAEILDEAEYAYADFDRYKEDILYAEPDELPDDDFRYGMERAVEIIDKCRKGGVE